MYKQITYQRQIIIVIEKSFLDVQICCHTDCSKMRKMLTGQHRYYSSNFICHAQAFILRMPHNFADHTVQCFSLWIPSNVFMKCPNYWQDQTDYTYITCPLVLTGENECKKLGFIIPWKCVFFAPLKAVQKVRWNIFSMSLIIPKHWKSVRQISSSWIRRWLMHNCVAFN